MYNSAAFAEAMIESCKAQTITDWQLRIYNDGSDDIDTRFLLFPPGGNDQPLVENAAVWNGLHVGPVRAMNRAFEMGLDVRLGAKVIARLDADDAMAPDRLAKQLALIDEGADIVSCDMMLIDEAGRQLGPCMVGGMDPERFLAAEHSHGPVDASLVCRREVYEQVGLWNPAYPWSAASEWLFRALGFGFKWAHVAEPLYHYRRHAGQLTKAGRGKGHETYAFLAERARTWNAHPASR